MQTTKFSHILGGDSRTRRLFAGVFPRDILVKKLITNKDIVYQKLIIFNTHSSDQSGEHWICLWFNKRGEVYVFDSLALSSSRLFDVSSALGVSANSIHWTHTRLQGLTTGVCGDYCLLFGLLIGRGWTPQMILRSFLRVPKRHLRDHAVRRIVLKRFGDDYYYKRDYDGVDFVHVKGLGFASKG